MIVRSGKRYDPGVDLDGNPLLVNRATGEVLQGRYVAVYPGDKIASPDQQEANRQYIENLKKAIGRRTASRDLGKYFFIAGGQRFSDIKPQSATRLIYLQTFADYSTHQGNRLKMNSKTNMKFDDLKKVLGLQRDAVKEFWDDVSPKYLIEDKDGLLINSDIFVKGTIYKQQNESFYRAYCRGVRKLYEATPKRKHGQLGYLFQLLPFINVEFNVLCFNPSETDIDRIEFMNLDEFCELIRYDKSKRDRLLEIYKGLTFDVADKDGTHRERFVSITGDGLTKGEHRLYVNPRVLYSGSDYKQVLILGGLSKGKT